MRILERGPLINVDNFKGRILRVALKKVFVTNFFFLGIFCWMEFCGHYYFVLKKYCSLF